MIPDSTLMVSMTEANRDFSKVVRLVDESGMAVILNNNKPCYMVLSFSDYDEIQAARQKFVGAAVDDIITGNLEALQELAQ